MNSEALDFKSISIRVVCITAIAIATGFLLLALTGCGPSNEERIKQRFARSEKILNIRQKYYKEYSKFLTQAQIEKVYKQERLLMKRYAK